MATTDLLITADDYLRMSDNGGRTELVRGRIIEVPPPGYEHGEVCLNIGHILRVFLKGRNLGRAISNDSGVVTERGPDTVRGMDIAFYSYGRLPKGQRPRAYPPQPPELIFEVRSPSDRSSQILTKVAEYLNSGVLRVCVVDPQRETVTVYHPEEPERRLTAG